MTFSQISREKSHIFIILNPSNKNPKISREKTLWWEKITTSGIFGAYLIFDPRKKHAKYNGLDSWEWINKYDSYCSHAKYGQTYAISRKFKTSLTNKTWFQEHSRTHIYNIWYIYLSIIFQKFAIVYRTPFLSCRPLDWGSIAGSKLVPWSEIRSL